MTHNCRVSIELHDDKESCGPSAGGHGDGDLVLAPGHVVLGVGAGAGAPAARHPGGHRGRILGAGGRVRGILSPEAVQLTRVRVPVTCVGALVTANRKMYRKKESGAFLSDAKLRVKP